MPQVLSAKDFDALVQKLGSVGAAAQWAKANGYNVDWDGEGGIELEPTLDQQPAGGLSVASAQTEAAPEEAEGVAQEDAQEEDSAVPSSGGLSLLGYLKDQQRTRKEAFDEGQKYIAQMYAGPSRSQQLFALSKALLSPKPYRGFTGTLANVSSALADISKSQDDAQQKRLLAEAQLMQSYKSKTADDMYEEAKLRYMIDKAKGDAAAKEAKARAPIYQLNPLSGKPVEVPRFAHRPVTKADYDAIPVGEFYVVPAGPQAGEIVRKIK